MFRGRNCRGLGREDLLAVIEDSNCEVLKLKAEVARARKEGQGIMSYYKGEVPLKVGDLLPSQRQRSAIQFRRSSYEIFAKLKRDGFIVLELPTVEKDKLSSAYECLMNYRCKATFEGSFLSARNLPHRHVLEFNAGASAVLVNQELPPGEDDWTQAHQTEAFETMHALKVATTSVLDAISFATGVGMNTVRHHLLEEDVPLVGEMLSSSILHVVSYAPVSQVEAKETATRDEHVDAGLLTAVYCPTPGLQVQGANKRGQATHQEPDQPGHWTRVPYGHDTIVVMVGHTLEHATGGVLRACIHRVWPCTSRPGRTALAFKLRARSTAILPWGLMRIDSRGACQEGEADEANTVGALMRMFRGTHGPSLNGTPMISAPPGEEQVHRRMHAEMYDFRDCGTMSDCGTQLFLKTVDGKTLTLECETLLCTGLELKRRVQQKTGFSLAAMRLISSGMQLENYDVLPDCNVGRESTIHMTGRLCGD